MTKHGIVVYSFLLKNKKNENYIKLNKDINFSKEFNQIIDKYGVITDNEEIQKLFSIKKIVPQKTEDSNFYYYPFIVTSGSYGIESSIMDRKSNQIKHKKNKDEADMKNFICMVAIPKDIDNFENTKGLIFFQTIGTYGIKIITTTHLNDFFKSKGLIFITRHILLKKLANEIFKKGVFKKITITQNNISPDLCDNIIQSSGKVKTTYINPILKKTWLKQLIDKLSNNSDSNLLEFEDITYNDIEINFDYNGRRRTMKLGDIDALSFPINIPNEIIISKNSEQEIINFITSLATDYKNYLILNETIKK